MIIDAAQSELKWWSMSRVKQCRSYAVNILTPAEKLQVTDLTDDISDLFDDGDMTASAVMQESDDKDNIFHAIYRIIDDIFNTTNAVGCPVKV